MAKFRFRLQVVLEQRKKVEDSALAALADTQRKLLVEQARKAELQNQLERGLERRESLGMVATEIEQFIIEEEFIRGTKTRILAAEHHVLRAKRSVEKAMMGYLHAKRRLRQIQILEEKAREDFRVEKRKKEDRELDETALLRARFRSQGEWA